MPAPTIAEVQAYVAETGGTYTQPEVQAALDAEKAAQRAACRVPADADPWPKNLATALMRRVARHLNVKALPLGPGGADPDAETGRLEGPYRRKPLG